MEKFYLVWEPFSGYTRYRHTNQKLALEEAERLAGIERDKEFYVLEALTVSKTKTPVETVVLNPVTEETAGN